MTDWTVRAMIGAVVLSAALTPLLRWYAHYRGLIDQPGPRRSHAAPIARGGGLAVAVAVVATLMLADGSWILPFSIGVAAVALLGWVDDHGALPVRVRLAGQLVVVAGTMAWVGPVESVLVGGWELNAPIAWTVLACVAMIWLINLFNFMDGSDGLACVQTVASGLLFAAAFAASDNGELASLALVAASASAGFLAWNRPPASIFLGDSGSLSLGFIIAFLALAGTLTATVTIALAFIIVAPFVVDATATLVSRVVSGQRWYTPHREHAYQSLIRRGWTHAGVLGSMVLINALLIAPITFMVIRRPELDLVAALMVGGVLVGLWFLARRGTLAERLDV